jgi:hypothetical protein
LARKRRDRERDPSSAEKVAKLGGAALAIGASAALFNRSNVGLKFHKEVMPALTKTHRNIGRELVGKKITAKQLSETYNRHIGTNGSTFKALMKENADSPIKLRLDRTDNLAGMHKNVLQYLNNGVKKDIKNVYKGIVKKDIVAGLTHKDAYGKDRLADIHQIVENAFDKVDKVTMNNSYSGDFLKKTFADFDFNDTDKNKILNFIHASKQEAMHPDKVKDFVGKQDNFISQIEAKTINADFYSKKQQSFLHKASSTLKNKFGINADLEQLLTNSKAATLSDINELVNQNSNLLDQNSFLTALTQDAKGQNFNILNSLNELNVDGALNDVVVDKTLRIRRGPNGAELFSTAATHEFMNNRLGEFATTIPGRLLKGIDLKQQTTNPIHGLLQQGKLSLASYLDDSSNRTLAKNRLFIGNSLFDINETNGALSLSDEAVAEGGLIVSQKHGSAARLIQDFLGTNRKLQGISDNPMAQLLDLGQNGRPNSVGRLKAWLTKSKNESWERNVLDNTKDTFSSYDAMEAKIEARANTLMTGDMTLEQAKTRARAAIFEENETVNSILDDFTASNQISDGVINKLLDSGVISEDSQHLLNLLKDHEDMGQLVNAVSVKEGQKRGFLNEDLKNLINSYYKDSASFTNMLNISSSDTANIPLLDMSLASTNSLDIEHIMRREVVKEVLVNELDNNFNNMYNIIDAAGLNSKESQNIRFLGNWGLFQKHSGITNDIDHELKLDDLFGKYGSLKEFDDQLSANPGFKQQFLGMFEDLKDDYGILDKGTFGNITEQYSSEFNDFEYVKKSAFGLDLLTNLNDMTKLRAAGKELVAGRNNVGDYSLASMLVQNSVARLVYGVEEFGIGFSSKSTGGALDLVKNIALKRILPVMAATSLYDYLDYESENLTGTSITGAAANAVSNVDVALRKGAYSTGVGQILDWAKESSVVGEYWTGTNEFQDGEERKEWYKNGYSPVRSGRFWSFGSASEFRGSGIQYYQPNYLKRAHSNYNEVSIYGSAEEKFSHSLMPSLRHPFSTVNFLLNPYWLEKKHQDDRPYPLTGKLFSEGTPWGAVLNPTLGEMIKPVRMLPEIKRRLGKDGRDVRGVIQGLNERIKDRANRNDDMLIVDGTDIRTANYTPYGKPTNTEINLQYRNGQMYSPGIDYMNGINNINNYVAPTGDVYINDSYGGIDADGMTGQIKMPGKVQEDINEITTEINSSASTDIIAGLNNTIKSFAGRRRANSAFSAGRLPGKEDGSYVYTNNISKRAVFDNNFYSARFDPRLIDKSPLNDYGADIAHSLTQLGGMYGFLGEEMFGEDSYKLRYEQAGNMYSFTRSFWDANIGGLGGGIMEIGRRFFPSEDRSRVNVNPLVNNMPDWLPQRYLTGDAYAALPKGDMRMPGKGYETLNALHGDQFGEYGAFDRFKILADIAPTSEEYKTWLNIARNTIQDPELLAQMEEIELRAKKMSSKHEFYEYRYVNNNTKYNNGVVKSVNGDGTVTLSTGENLSLAGVTMNTDPETPGSIYDLLQAGEMITYRTSKNAIKRLEDGITTAAVIYKNDSMPGSATNINKSLVDMGIAQRDKKDTTALGHLASLSSGQEVLGSIQEILTHAKIPIIHNKLFKIETAFESYKNELVFGSPFTTWDHPIEGFVKPMFNNTFGQSPFQHALAIAAVGFHNKYGLATESKLLANTSRLAMATLNPAAMFGGMFGWAARLNNGVANSANGRRLTAFDRGSNLGAIAGTIGWGIANADNPLKAASSFAVAGAYISAKLEIAPWMKEMGKEFHIGKGALIGAAVGLGVSAIKNPDFDKDRMFNKWVPKSTRKKWELDEYFDRLEYVKYQGLYKAAAFRARVFEGSEIGSILKRVDKNKKKIAKLQRKADEASNKYIAGSYEYNEKTQELQKQIRALQESQKQVFSGGKYTKAAIGYKKAVESTIYGLSETATPDEILAAVPDQFKDHFKAFMNERDKGKRKQILKYIPDYLKRPLEIAWGEKPTKVKKNTRYFKDHGMPGFAWKGWKPNINLKHVKMKTIENEGMLLSDFGFYESEKSKASYQLAPDIEKYDSGQSGLGYRLNMLSTLQGLGLSVHNISVEPTSAPGLWIGSDIKQTVDDVNKITGYAIGSGIQSIVSTLF